MVNLSYKLSWLKGEQLRPGVTLSAAARIKTRLVSVYVNVVWQVFMELDDKMQEQLHSW